MSIGNEQTQVYIGHSILVLLILIYIILDIIHW